MSDYRIRKVANGWILSEMAENCSPSFPKAEHVFNNAQAMANWIATLEGNAGKAIVGGSNQANAQLLGNAYANASNLGAGIGSAMDIARCACGRIR